MTVINGLPAHMLLIHFLVVLAPLTALSEIICALWAPARRRLVWPVLLLAIATAVLTPITTEAGEWLYGQKRQHTPVLVKHAEMGGWMIYFSVALLLVAIILVALHVLEDRSDKRRIVANVVVAVLAVAVGVASMIQIYRIGDAGSQSVWGNELTKSAKP